MKTKIQIQIHKTLRVGFACLLALTLSYCANTPRLSQAPEPWQQHVSRVESLNIWEMRAKLAIRAPKSNGSASLNWQQQNQHYTIQLSGPFGSGKVIIKGSPNKASLEQAGAAPIMASNAEALLYEATGWQLPLKQLTTWVRGIPATSLPIEAMEHNEQGLLRHLEQAGWSITYSRYKTYNNFTLPGRIVATHDNLKLILAIHRWKIND